MSTLEFHPLADIFPLIDGADFDELVADIKAHGLHEPIAVFEDKILDGRNRYRACMAAGVPCPTRPYEGNDPVGFVVSLNLKRRHLSESQRAMVAAKLATFGHGGDRSKSPSGDSTQAKAADLLNVGKRSVERAAEVRDHGAPELVRVVEQGAVSITAAADIAGQPIDEQREIVAQGEREILRAAIQIPARKAAARRVERHATLIRLSNVDSPLPERRFPIMLADPPYQYDRRWAVSREIENHYPTMTTEAICNLPVAGFSTPDAMLFLWAPAPL